MHVMTCSNEQVHRNRGLQADSQIVLTPGHNCTLRSSPAVQDDGSCDRTLRPHHQLLDKRKQSVYSWQMMSKSIKGHLNQQQLVSALFCVELHAAKENSTCKSRSSPGDCQVKMEIPWTLLVVVLKLTSHWQTSQVDAVGEKSMGRRLGLLLQYHIACAGSP